MRKFVIIIFRKQGILFSVSKLLKTKICGYTMIIDRIMRCWSFQPCARRMLYAHESSARNLNTKTQVFRANLASRIQPFELGFTGENVKPTSCSSTFFGQQEHQSAIIGGQQSFHPLFPFTRGTCLDCLNIFIRIISKFSDVLTFRLSGLLI